MPLLSPPACRDWPDVLDYILLNQDDFIGEIDGGADVVGEESEFVADGRGEARSQAHDAMFFVHALDDAVSAIGGDAIAFQSGERGDDIAAEGL